MNATNPGLERACHTLCGKRALQLIRCTEPNASVKVTLIQQAESARAASSGPGCSAARTVL